MGSRLRRYIYLVLVLAVIIDNKLNVDPTYLPIVFFSIIWPFYGDRAVPVDCIIRGVHAIANGDGPNTPN